MIQDNIEHYLTLICDNIQKYSGCLIDQLTTFGRSWEYLTRLKNIGNIWKYCKIFVNICQYCTILHNSRDIWRDISHTVGGGSKNIKTLVCPSY